MLQLRASGDLICLLALSAFVQWQICRNAVVPAFDAVRHVALAQSIELQGVWPVLRQTADQPLFPALVAAAHRLIAAAGGAQAGDWLLAVQFTASAGIVLCVVPLYFLLRDWLGRARALIGCAIFLVLPEVTRIGAEGLGDGWVLFALLVALACLIHRFAKLRAQWCATKPASSSAKEIAWQSAAGAATGVSLLGATSAVVMPFALALLLATRPSMSLTLCRQLRWFVPFAIGIVVVLGSYLVSVGAIAPSAILARLLGSHRAETAAIVNAPLVSLGSPAQWFESNGTPLEFTRGDSHTTIRKRGWLAAISGFGGQIGQLTHYWIGLVAAYGAWKMRRARNCWPGRFLFCFALTYAVIAMAYAAHSGYLCARHLLPMTPVLVGWASQGVASLSVHSLEFIRRASNKWTSVAMPPARAAWLTAALIVPVLPVTFLPLHQHRFGHRAAAEWLTTHADENATIFDTSGLTGLYSGRTTFRAEAGNVALASARLGYVVVDSWELRSESRRAATLNAVLKTSADLIARFSPSADSRGEPVLLYRWRPERFARHFSTQSLKQ